MKREVIMKLFYQIADFFRRLWFRQPSALLPAKALGRHPGQFEVGNVISDVGRTLKRRPPLVIGRRELGSRVGIDELRRRFANDVDNLE